MSVLPPRARIAATALIAMLCLNGMTSADTTNEAAVKVAFLYNFFKFIEWPAASTTENGYNLCFASSEELGDNLQVLESKTVNDKPIRLFRQVSDNDLKSCHMLFIGAAENPSRYLNSVKGLPIVTVSDKADFINHQGMIGLIRDANRLGFEINLDTANAGNIRISAQLLKLAKHVNTNP